VRVVCDIMIVNHERNMSKIGRRAEQLPAARRVLAEVPKREPTRKEIAAKMSVTENDLAMLEAFEQRGYDDGGFKIYDVSEPARPKLVCYHKTGGIGVHRFDMDERHAYISTEMKGYVGNILVIYDLRDPRRPQEVSRWWMPGQHVEGGETPTWSGRRHRLHHALRFGDEMWASCWRAGFQTGDEAVPDRIAPTREDDRYRRGCGLGRVRRRAICDDHGHRPANQFSHQCRQSIRLTFRRAVLVMNLGMSTNPMSLIVSMFPSNMLIR
jgi:hypothetical protein